MQPQFHTGVAATPSSATRNFGQQKIGGSAEKRGEPVYSHPYPQIQLKSLKGPRYKSTEGFKAILAWVGCRKEKARHMAALALTYKSHKNEDQTGQREEEKGCEKGSATTQEPPPADPGIRNGFCMNCANLGLFHEVSPLGRGCSSVGPFHRLSSSGTVPMESLPWAQFFRSYSMVNSFHGFSSSGPAPPWVLSGVPSPASKPASASTCRNSSQKPPPLITSLATYMDTERHITKALEPGEAITRPPRGQFSKASQRGAQITNHCRSVYGLGELSNFEKLAEFISDFALRV
ncbi:hypothetical protein TURU_059435 [Turdus rufiventris]|nr:hypothetical protein TURU_059435 [Turdus rufiventris]